MLKRFFVGMIMVFTAAMILLSGVNASAAERSTVSSAGKEVKKLTITKIAKKQKKLKNKITNVKKECNQYKAEYKQAKQSAEALDTLLQDNYVLQDSRIIFLGSKFGNRENVNHQKLVSIADTTEDEYLSYLLDEYVFGDTLKNTDVSELCETAQNMVSQTDVTVDISYYLTQKRDEYQETCTSSLKEYKKHSKKLQELKSKYEKIEGKEIRLFDPTDLSKESHITAEEYNQMLDGTGMAGLGSALVKCEKLYHVNGFALMGIAIHESGWGSSRRARVDGNMTGLGVSSNSSRGYNPGGSGLAAKEQNLLMTAKCLHDNYLQTNGKYYKGKGFEGVNYYYCAGGDWARMIVSTLYQVWNQNQTVFGK